MTPKTYVGIDPHKTTLTIGVRDNITVFLRYDTEFSKWT